MKKSLLGLALLATATTFAIQAQADTRSGFYAGGAFSMADTGLDDANGSDLDFTMLEISGGYKYNSWLGVEARIGTGVNGNEDSNYDYSIGHYESIYWRPETQNEIAKLYGLLGYTNLSLDAENRLTGESVDSQSYSGLSLGAGVGFAVGERSNVNLEYKNIVKDDDIDFRGFSIGYDYRF
ncbi:porin family protein [Agaribacterium sp. ZY112]|uniref:porin family protein n=1 Tax=Agaribacterium sp. ZY112 TaxID=3233574 RepID=UPI003525EA47